MRPLISIIIPTFNRAELISETLDSILAQTYTNWECIIVDDGSTDNTDEVVGSYVDKDSRFQYHQRPLNKLKGPNSCRNYGFELSNGDYIKWFDSDDILVPFALEYIMQSFLNDCEVVVSSLEYVDFDKRKMEIKHNFISNNIISDYIVGEITFFTFTPTWRKSFLNNQAELFDEEISNLDDWDFNLRMLYENPNIVYIDLPLIQYRVHENSLSKEISKLNFEEIKSEFRAREKHLKLICINKKTNSLILQIYIKNRYKFILRKTLVEKHVESFYFFRMLLKKQVLLYDFAGVFKTIFGFCVYKILNKGYKYLN